MARGSSRSGTPRVGSGSGSTNCQNGKNWNAARLAASKWCRWVVPVRGKPVTISCATRCCAGTSPAVRKRCRCACSIAALRTWARSIRRSSSERRLSPAACAAVSEYRSSRRCDSRFDGSCRTAHMSVRWQHNLFLCVADAYGVCWWRRTHQRKVFDRGIADAGSERLVGAKPKRIQRPQQLADCVDERH